MIGRIWNFSRVEAESRDVGASVVTARQGFDRAAESRAGISRRGTRGRLGLCFFLSAVSLLLPGLPLWSQQQPSVSVNVNVVNVFATVRKKHGEIVRNLTRDDFTLEEDGRAQTIRYFAHESDLPLTLGLLVDTSMSQRRVLDQERSASYTFLDQVLRVDKDMAFVIHFDREVELLQDLTSSRQKLQAALASLETPRPTQDEGGGSSSGSQPGSHRRDGDSGGGRAHGGGTLLYDAVYLASNELMKKQQGRKALIVLSDGVDRGSKETLASAVEAAQRADTLVYSVLFADEQGYGGRGFGGRGMGGMGGMGRRGGGRGRYPQPERPDGKKILERISKETGGRLFEVSKKQPVEQIYDDVEQELRNQYSLGYTPDRAGAAGAGYHKIRLLTKEKGLVVQARDGYYADR
jgi:VWFA-related protein